MLGQTPRAGSACQGSAPLTWLSSPSERKSLHRLASPRRVTAQGRPGFALCSSQLVSIVGFKRTWMETLGLVMNRGCVIISLMNDALCLNKLIYEIKRSWFNVGECISNLFVISRLFIMSVIGSFENECCHLYGPTEVVRHPFMEHIVTTYGSTYSKYSSDRLQEESLK